MTITINGKEAALKEGTSFEYIAENRLFTGSDSYTLAISFPLQDCQQNIEIFGHIHRTDVEKKKVVFNCDIRDKAFFKSGSITITSISEVEVKTQFLEGRSEQNFKDNFDSIYINEISIPGPSSVIASGVPLPEGQCFPAVNWVALPWLNNTSGNIQNEETYDSSTGYAWKTLTEKCSFQPYLIYVIKCICDAVGYSVDLSRLEQSDYRYLLICNTTPAAWNLSGFQYALPHWSLSEFFSQLENLLFGEFEINHKARSISFNFSAEVVSHTPSVRMDKVIDSYTADVSQENTSDYIGVKNLTYAKNDNRLWNYRSCEWYIRRYKETAKHFATLNELLQYAKQFEISGVYESTNRRGGTSTLYIRGYRGDSDGNSLFYAEDVATYFIMYCYKSELVKTQEVYNYGTMNLYKYYNRLEPVNEFGDRFIDKEADEVAIDIVPAWIDDTDDEHGPCFFLECGTLDGVELASESDGVVTSNEQVRGRGSSSTVTDDTDYNGGALAQSTASKAIGQGEQEKGTAFFSQLYVAFWDGVNRHPGLMHRPSVDRVETDNKFKATITPFSLRINEDAVVNRSIVHNINAKQKYHFSFLADSMPNPRAVFFINGQRYICEKMTATFTAEQGMSQVIKFEGYQLVE